MKTFIALAMAVTLAIATPFAEAKRMGGGASVGKQSSNVTQRQAPAQSNPANPSAAPNNAAQKPAPNTPAAAPAAAAAQPKKPWGAMLGGLAAGLGLAWLAHSLGFGEAFGNILTALLLGMVVLAIIGFILRKRAASSVKNAPIAPNFAQPTMATVGDGVASAPQYNPARVGNDASARPWEQPAAAGSIIGADLGNTSQNSSNFNNFGNAQSTWVVPAGFDVSAFERAAHANFIALQAAWDRADIATLRSMMTDEMLAEIQAQIEERQAAGEAESFTEVLELQAKFLGIEDQGDGWMASVEFNGLIREERGAAPEPMREIWNMTRPKTGPGGWLVAGLQPLSVE